MLQLLRQVVFSQVKCEFKTNRILDLISLKVIEELDETKINNLDLNSLENFLEKEKKRIITHLILLKEFTNENAIFLKFNLNSSSLDWVIVSETTEIFKGYYDVSIDFSLTRDINLDDLVSFLIESVLDDYSFFNF